MTTYRTGNPLGSTDPRDLLDNAQNLDEALLTDQATFTDRLGRTRVSWEGAIAYSVLSETYAAGIEVTTRNQVILADGEYWKVAGSTVLPYTTNGAGMPEGGAFVSVGDAVLRQDLAAPGGAGLVAGGVVMQVDTIADLLAIDTSQMPDGQQVSVKEYHYGTGVGGGNFWFALGGVGTDDSGTVFSASNGRWFRQFASGEVYVEWYGAIGDGVNDDLNAINAAIAAYRRVKARTNATYRVSGSIRPRTKSYLDFSNAEIVSSLPVALIKLDNCLYATVRNAKLDVPAGGEGLVIDSPDAEASASQFNRFYDIDIECNGRINTTALRLGVCWSNQFHSCNFLRSTVGVQFGSDLLPDNRCNANHFYGCEVRSVSAFGGTAVVHYGGDNNALFGGIIENWEFGAVIYGGSFLLSGVYLEAFSAGRGFQMYGGQFTIRDCFNNYGTTIYGGHSFRFEGHHFIESTWDTGSGYNSSYPGIAMYADVDTRVTVDVAIPPDKSFVIREGECFVSGVWQKRTAGYEDIRWVTPKFSARLAADRLGVTGNGTDYRVNYGNNKEFVRPAGVLDNSGVFTAPVFGTYRFAGQLRMSGLADGATINVRVASSNRNYYGYLDKVTSGQLGSGGTYLVKLDCFAELEVGDTVSVFVSVSGQSADSVSVIRGNAVDGYTTFAGFKV